MHNKKIPINFGILDINIEDSTSVVKQLNYNSEIKNHVDCTAESILRRNILKNRNLRRNEKRISLPV